MCVNCLIREQMRIARKSLERLLMGPGFLFGNWKLNQKTFRYYGNDGHIALWIYFTKTTSMYKISPGREGPSAGDKPLQVILLVRPMMNIQIEPGTCPTQPRRMKHASWFYSSLLTKPLCGTRQSHGLSCLDYFLFGWLLETYSSVSSFYLH